MCLPQDANIHSFVQLYKQLSMKDHTGAFLISLDNPTLVPATPGPIFVKTSGSHQQNETLGRWGGISAGKPLLRPCAVSWR